MPSTFSPSLAVATHSAETAPAACQHVEPAISFRKLVKLLSQQRRLADDSDSAILMWLLADDLPRSAARQEFARSLPPELLGSRISVIPLRGNYLAVLANNVAHENVAAIKEMMTGALPGDKRVAEFSYPTDWYEIDNVAPFAFKDQVHVGADYLKHAVDDASHARFLLEESNRESLWLEPAFFLPTPAWKRLTDIVVAGLALLLLSPLLLLICLIVKAYTSGPLLFWQARHGGGGRKFEMCKFRTMCPNFDVAEHSRHLQELLDSGQPLKKLDVDQALIPHAKWIRAMGFDELPQLWNVLRGDMSVVGPRPDVVTMANYKSWQRRRFDVVPGLTGLWQVSGKNRTTFEQMMQYDVTYIEHRSFWNDARIILKTLPAIVRVALD